MLNRDSRTVSLWQEDIPVFQPQPYNGSKEFDVLIVGGGITGITTGCLLQQSGFRCVIIEADKLCHGTTSGTTAHVNSLLDTTYDEVEKDFGMKQAQLLYQATLAARRLIQSNLQQFRFDCDYRDCTAFLYAKDEEQEKQLISIALKAQEAGVDLSFASDIPLPAEFRKSIRVTHEAALHPIKYVYGLAKEFEKFGGVILEEHSYADSRRVKSKLEIETNRGNFYANDLVFATHPPPNFTQVQMKFTPWRSYVMAYTTEQMLADDVLVYDLDEPYHYFRSHEVKGEKLIIAGGEDHRTGQMEGQENSFLKLEAYLKTIYPDLQIKYYWSAQYYESIDGLPYIGRMPSKKDNYFLATGFGGNGIMYSQVSALLLRDLLLDRSNDWERLFNPSRIKPVAGFSEFVSLMGTTLKNWFGKLNPHPPLDSFSELAAGEGKVVSRNNKRIAVCRDTNNQLHAVSAVCTHMGCEINWNAVEQSWDCPCHGARFSPDGKVLNGPATRDLEKIALEDPIR